MPAPQSLLLVRRHWRLVASSVVACAALAALLALVRAPGYDSRVQFFVATPGADVGSAYRGELFSQQRVASYAAIVSSTELRRAVARELRLPGGARDLEGRLRASVPPDTVLIDVRARAGSPESAKAIAAAVGRQLPRLVRELEAPRTPAASPVRVAVTRAADLPGAPASPNLKLYLALGALAGLVVGLGAVALRTAFDDRVRSVEEIERILGAPVVGTVAEDEEAGASLVVLADPLSRRAEDYRRIRTRLRASSGTAAAASLVVAGAGAGERTSRIAANLAVVLARGGQRVVLVDGNLCAPRLGAYFGRSSGLGFADVLAGDVTLERVLVRSPELPLAVVGAGMPGEDRSELLASPRLPALIAELCAQADVVIVDAPPLASGAAAATLAAAAQGLLVVVRRGATRSAELEAAAQGPGPLIGAIVNRRPHRRSRAEPFAESEAEAATAATLDADSRAELEPSRQVASGRRA